MTRPQEIRHECLLQLYGARPLSISPQHIRKVARRQAFDYLEREVMTELEFLVGQNLASKNQDPATGETKYSITSAGILHYEKTDPE